MILSPKSFLNVLSLLTLSLSAGLAVSAATAEHAVLSTLEFHSDQSQPEWNVAQVVSASSGTVRLELVAGENWSADEERAIFVLGGKDHGVTLTAANSRIFARYANGDREPAVVAFRSWRLTPGSPLDIEFAWSQQDDARVLSWLIVNNSLIGLAESKPMAEVPETAFVGTAPGLAPWDGEVVSAQIRGSSQIPAELEPGSRTIHVRSEKTGDRLHGLWRVSNFAAMSDKYTFIGPDTTDVLRSKAPFVREVLVDFTLGGRFKDGQEWLLAVRPDGTLETDFSGLIDRIRAVLAAGLRPWLIMEKVPPVLTTEPAWNFYGQTAPSADLELWREYVRQAVQAMVDVFGRETVATWPFMVETEPDLHPAHWAGTRDEFFAHLDFTIDGIKSVLPEAQVSPGNMLDPAFAYEFRHQMGDDALQHVRARDQWGLQIIDHAGAGVNAATGERGTPMDFISASWYGSIGSSTEAFSHAVETMRARLDRYPQFKDVAIDIREFSVLVDEQGRRLYAGDSSEWSASFYAAIARRAYDQDVRAIFEWDSATYGVLHPRGHVLGMLERMVGAEELTVEVKHAESAAECGAIAAHTDDGRLLVLLFNHRPQRLAQITEQVTLLIDDPRMKKGEMWSISEWLVDRDHAVWAYAFNEDARAAGLDPLPHAGRHEASPNRYYGPKGVELFKQNIEKYGHLAELPMTRNQDVLRVDDGKVSLDVRMRGHSVRLLELSPPL